MSMISDNSSTGDRFRCKKCGREYKTSDKGHSLEPERRICQECRAVNNCEKGSLSELLTDYIQPHASKSVDEHPCWAELLELVGSDGERDGKVIYDRVVNLAVNYPDLAHLPSDELGTPSKRDLVLTLDIEKEVIPFIRLHEDKWSERDIEKVAKEVRRSGLGQSKKFTNLVRESYDAADGNRIKSIDITKPSIRSGFLLPDLFNVDSVADKAVVLAAVYAYYFDTQQWKPSSDEGENAGYQIGPAKQSVEAILLKFVDDEDVVDNLPNATDDDEVVDKTHVENFWHDVRLVPLIGKEEAANVLRWVDEVSAVCNPVAPEPPAATGTQAKPKSTPNSRPKKRLNEVWLECLKHHHQYEAPVNADPNCSILNWEPIGQREMARRYESRGLSSSTIQRCFKHYFESQKEYEKACRSGKLGRILLKLTVTEMDQHRQMQIDPELVVTEPMQQIQKPRRRDDRHLDSLSQDD